MYKGKLDYSYSLQYQSQRKKEKSADCIYLDEHRVCNCPNFENNGMKCFNATYCSKLVRESEAKPITNKKVIELKPIEQIPWDVGEKLLFSTVMQHIPVECRLIACDLANGIMCIEFEDGVVKRFKYPNCKNNFVKK